MCLKMRKKRSFLLWEQGVEGSNPFAPTLRIKELQEIVTPFFLPMWKICPSFAHRISQIEINF